MRSKIGKNSGSSSGRPLTLVKIWMPFRAELADGAVHLLERGRDVVHRQRRDEAREEVGVLLHDLGHPVVREARELRGFVLAAEELDRRHRQREHLLVAGPALHHADALVEVPKHRDVHPALERRGEARIALGDALHPLEVRLRERCAERCRASSRPASCGYPRCDRGRILGPYPTIRAAGTALARLVSTGSNASAPIFFSRKEYSNEGKDPCRLCINGHGCRSGPRAECGAERPAGHRLVRRAQCGRACPTPGAAGG